MPRGSNTFATHVLLLDDTIRVDPVGATAIYRAAPSLGMAIVRLHTLKPKRLTLLPKGEPS